MPGPAGAGTGAGGAGVGASAGAGMSTAKDPVLVGIHTPSPIERQKSPFSSFTE
ncbi:hypothetical protein [Paenibacillus oryzisoli]|uniref:hypothetical protein n=1 Tax=Paenibacillus oryzisoli TaxID=1850517 RepID=UPI000A8C2696|nr:hypothetical protein [Paenibacillus oryzisoli]